MKRVIMLVGLIGIAFAPAAWAANDGPGCGWGSQIFKGQSGIFPAILAVTLNATGSATIGMTFGTSGCSSDSVVLKEKEQEVFVGQNLSALNQEMAQGQGQHVAALASLMGCPTSVNGEFAQMSQESYGTVFASDEVSANVVLASLKQEMGRRPVLAASCSRLS